MSFSADRSQTFFRGSRVEKNMSSDALLERIRVIKARQAASEAEALRQRACSPSSEDEDEAGGGLGDAVEGENVQPGHALLERIRVIKARQAASEAEALRQRTCSPSSEDEDEAFAGLGDVNEGENVEQGSDAEQGSGEASDKVPKWSPWSGAGIWTLAGFSWRESCGRRPPSTAPQKVRKILVANPWAWDMDFDPADAAPTWHWIEPTTLTDEDATMLWQKARSCAYNDWLASWKQGKRRPEEDHPCEPIIGVAYVAYHWNLSLGWCTCSKCPRRDEGMTSYAPQVLKPNGRKDGSPDVFTCERRYNTGYHQAWNISGAIHNSCQALTNSHEVFGFDSTRTPDGSTEPFPTFETTGGPSAFFSNFVGGATQPLLDLDLTPGASYIINNQRIQRWCNANGFKHKQGCARRGKYGCQAGCRQKSTEIRLHHGLVAPRKNKDKTVRPAKKPAGRTKKKPVGLTADWFSDSSKESSEEDDSSEDRCSKDSSEESGAAPASAAAAATAPAKATAPVRKRKLRLGKEECGGCGLPVAWDRTRHSEDPRHKCTCCRHVVHSNPFVCKDAGATETALIASGDGRWYCSVDCSRS